MTIVRTVLGDIAPEALGVTYAHEHLVIDGGRPVELEPEFDLADVEAMAIEVAEAAQLGLRSVIDAMPCDAGRNAAMLAGIARRTGVNIVAPTGLHHDRYYGPTHWSHRVTVEEMGELFAADIIEGIDAYDYSGPVVRRTPFRAGIIKVAGSEGGPSPRDRRVLEAAALAHRQTGAPILTHCEHGTGALEQVRVLRERGVAPRHIVLSHVDRVVDREYHRELLGTGAYGEYDGSYRWEEGQPNGTVQLIRWMTDDGFDGQIVVGMDAARRRYYRVHGGEPGLVWLLDGFTRLLDAAGVDESVRHRLFVTNPARAFAFALAPMSPG